MIEWVQKRDGRIVPFHAEKIADAIFAAARAVGGENRRQAEELAGQVIHQLQQSILAQEVPQVEEIQDLVEKVLIEQGHARTAKAFILYRNQRTRIREAKSELMDVVSEIFQEAGSDAQFLSAPLGKLQRIAIAASERYSLHNLLPRDFSAAHQRARIHIDRLAHYATAVTAAVIDLKPLLEKGLRLGCIDVPQLRTLEDFEQAVQALIVAAQSETIEEVLFADLDQVYALLCSQNRLHPSQAEVERLANRLLTAINLARLGGAVDSLKVCMGLGLDTSDRGQQLTLALFKALRKDNCAQAPLIAAQVIYRLQAGVNLLPTDIAYSTHLLAQETAQEKGNPSFVWVDAGVREHYLASGTRLESKAAILSSRTYLNLPRLALEVDSERDFLANIDSLFSLAAKQSVHRSEILTALQPPDLPLTASPLCKGVAAEPLLATALLLLVPIGIEEALQVVRHRFSSTAILSVASFVNLLNEICEHWGSYYSLNLQVGVGTAGAVARRFFTHDAGHYPLVRNLWPQAIAYNCLIAGQSDIVCKGGQLSVWTQVEQMRPGIVYALPLSQTVCLRCGHDIVNGSRRCPQCHGNELGHMKQEGGYLELRQAMPTN